MILKNSWIIAVVLESLLEKDSMDIGKIIGAQLIWVQIDSSNPLPKILQYPLKTEAKEQCRPFVSREVTNYYLHQFLSPTKLWKSIRDKWNIKPEII